MINDLNWIKLPNESGKWLIEFLIKGHEYQSSLISASLYDCKNHPDHQKISERDKQSWTGPELFGFIPKIGERTWSYKSFTLIEECFGNWKYEQFFDIPFGNAWILKSLKLE